MLTHADPKYGRSFLSKNKEFIRNVDIKLMSLQIFMQITVQSLASEVYFPKGEPLANFRKRGTASDEI